MLSMARASFMAACAIAAIFGAASSSIAAEFTISPAENFRAVSSGKISFTAGEATIACKLTLLLNTSSQPFVKSEGPIASLLSLSREECTGGELETILGVPWTISYVSIAGTLPEAVTSTSLRINNARFRFSLFFGILNCLYGGNVGAILTLSYMRGSSPARYTTSTLRADETTTQSYVSGPESCPNTGSLRGTFALSTTQTITRT